MSRPVAVASTRASVSTTLPRATLTSRAPSGIAARKARSTRPVVASLSGTITTTTSCWGSRSGSSSMPCTWPHQVVPVAGPRGDRGQRHLEAGEAARDRPADRAVAEDQDALVGQRRTAADRHPPRLVLRPAPSPGSRAATPASARPPARRWTRRARRRRWRGPRRAGPGAARRRTRRSAAAPARSEGSVARRASGSRLPMYGGTTTSISSRPGRLGDDVPRHRLHAGDGADHLDPLGVGQGDQRHGPARYRPQWVMRSLALLVAVSLLPLGACSAAGERRAPPRTGSAASSSSDLGAGSPTPGSGTGTGTSPGRRVRDPLPRHGAPDDTGRRWRSRLKVPWGLAFLPDGSALVTLRDEGTVLRVRADGAAPVRRRHRPRRRSRSVRRGCSASPSRPGSPRTTASSSTSRRPRTTA